MVILDKDILEEAQLQTQNLLEKAEEAFQAKLFEHYQFLLSQADEAREMKMAEYADALDEAARVLAETFELPVDDDGEEEDSEEEDSEEEGDSAEEEDSEEEDLEGEGLV